MTSSPTDRGSHKVVLMSTIFTKIANGEIPSYKVAENEDFYAFLDIAPMAKGHTLVIPKHTEEDYICLLYTSPSPRD